MWTLTINETTYHCELKFYDLGWGFMILKHNGKLICAQLKYRVQYDQALQGIPFVTTCQTSKGKYKCLLVSNNINQ